MSDVMSTSSTTASRAIERTGSQTANEHLLEAFADAFNRRDIEALMSMMTHDCVFEAAAGPDACGVRHVGQQAVRGAFAGVFTSFPDSRWLNARHFVSGDRGLSEWTYSATRNDGTRIEVNGCDVFTLREGKIQVKNSFRKDRLPIPAKGR